MHADLADDATRYDQPRSIGNTDADENSLAILIVPYIQLVFGSETTIRALCRRPFPRSPTWALPVCLGVVIAALIATYGVTRVTVPPEFCFAELLWLVQRWALGAFVLLTLIASIMLIGSLIICIRLYKSLSISEAQRTTASSTACYMLLALVTTVCLIPPTMSRHVVVNTGARTGALTLPSDRQRCCPSTGACTSTTRAA